MKSLKYKLISEDRLEIYCPKTKLACDIFITKPEYNQIKLYEKYINKNEVLTNFVLEEDFKFIELKIDSAIIVIQLITNDFNKLMYILY